MRDGVYGIIYLIRNTVSGKLYVGQTTVGLEQRFKGHQAGAKRQAISLLSRAIAKHSPACFERSVLFEAFDHESLNKAEVALIEAYQTAAPNGYNLSLGGGSSPYFKEIRAERFVTNIQKAKARIKRQRSEQCGRELRALGYDPKKHGADDLLAYAVARHLGISREMIVGMQ